MSFLGAAGSRKPMSARDFSQCCSMPVTWAASANARTSVRAELVEAFSSFNPSTGSGRKDIRELADAFQVTGMLQHWEKSLADIGFLDPAAPKKLMPRLNQLFNRAALSPEEIHILRGIAKAMTEAAKGK